MFERVVYRELAAAVSCRDGEMEDAAGRPRRRRFGTVEKSIASACSSNADRSASVTCDATGYPRGIAHPASGKTVAGQPDQHLGREIRQRLRKCQQTRAAAMA